MRTLKLFVLLSIVAIVFAGCGEKEKHSIKLNLLEGETIKMLTAIEQDIKQTIQGNVQNVKTKITMTVDFDVTKIEGDTINMDMTYDRMAMDISMPQMNMSFDSDKEDEGNPMYQVLSQLIGKKLHMKVLTNGDVVSVSNFEKLLNDVIDNIDPQGGMNKEQIKGQLRQSFGENSVISNFKMMFGYIPPEQVGVGEKWESKTETNFMVKGTYDSQWILKEYDKDNALITGTTMINSERSELSMGNMMNTPMEIELNGEQKAVMNINPQTGWIKTGKSDITMNGTLYLSSQQTGDMEIPMEIVMTVNYETLQ